MKKSARVAASMLAAAAILAAAVLLCSCATDTGRNRASDESGVSDSAPHPDEPQTSGLEPSRRTTPLRFPRLLDDPETPAPAGPAIAADPGMLNPGSVGGRRPATDPIVEEMLASLTLRQRVGQRFIAHVQGSHITYGAGRAIVEVAPAGFVIYPWNFRTAADVRRLTESLQGLARSVTPGIDLLLCADQEGGRVATFRFPEFVQIPSAASMGALGGSSIEAAAYLTGVQMRSLGLNMNLAPVLDVYGEADSTIIGDRSYSGDPAAVAAVVGPFLRGSSRAGMISVGKHFPGHGITTVDSHSALPVVDASLADIRARDLVPFQVAIEEGIEVLMTGHILYEAIDPFFPATLSRFFLKDLLRDELGFDGVVMSDGLEMGAIGDNYDLAESLIRLFKNDVDLILLFVNYDVVQLVDMVLALIRIGEITEDDVDRGVRRVLRLKLENGLVRPEDL